MRSLKKIILLAFILIIAVMSMSACGVWKTPYESLDGEGFNISVKFDANGGAFAGVNDVCVVDVFSKDNVVSGAEGKSGIKLFAPDDPIRKDDAFEISKPNCFLAGWYLEREPRVNENGEPLDENGVLTSVSGKEQGYVYSKKWDFDSDLLEIDMDGSYSASENVITLYAAWVPYFTYEFYAEDGQGGYKNIGDVALIDLEIPEWNERTGKLDMKKVPRVDGMTFDGAYYDEEMTMPITSTISGQVDYEKGISTTEVIKVYTTWLEGDWYKIYNAKQFYDNSKPGGNYILCADIDFADSVWAPTLVKGTFTGTIKGNGYKISNITVTQGDISTFSAGLFGSLGAGAAIENVTFENVTFILEAGSRMAGAAFGLLAGTISDDVTLENVSITGSILVSDNCYPSDSYVVGLVAGSGSDHGIDASGISCGTLTENSTKVSVTKDSDGKSVTITFVQ